MIIKVKQWQIIEHAPEMGQEPKFSVVIADQDVSARPLLVPLPYTGITDTTITPDSHDLYMEMSSPSQPNDPKTCKDMVFFRPRTLTEEGGAPKNSEFGNTPIGATFGDPVNQRRKALIDDSTGMGITVSDKTTAFGTPGREMLVGKKGITFLSGSPTIASLPEEDLLIFKQKGIGQLAPQCFIPPFCFPEYMPNLEFAGQVSKVVDILKAIRSLPV